MKRDIINKQANKIIKSMFDSMDIRTCELKLKDCTGSFMLSFCHRHKRRWYYDKPDLLLSHYNQVILGCLSCHQKIEQSKELTEEVFKKLRGADYEEEN